MRKRPVVAESPFPFDDLDHLAQVVAANDEDLHFKLRLREAIASGCLASIPVRRYCSTSGGVLRSLAKRFLSMAFS